MNSFTPTLVAAMGWPMLKDSPPANWRSPIPYYHVLGSKSGAYLMHQPSRFEYHKPLLQFVFKWPIPATFLFIFVLFSLQLQKSKLKKA